MRDYENSDTSSFNTYRSGNENPRRENSSRSETGSPSSVTRPGSNPSTADHFQRNSMWHQPQDYRDLRHEGSQHGNRSQQSNWDHNERSQYSPGNYRNQDQNRWPQDNRQQMGNYGNHSQDRDWDSHRSGDRSYYENRDQNQNQSWNRWNEGQRGEDQNDYRGYGDRSRQQSPNRYSSDFGYQNPTNQGRGYDGNRYQGRRQDEDDRDEGFFDRMGNSIRNAWHRLTDEEREDQERANRYEQRNQNFRNEDNRRSTRRDSGTEGPPYSWGSASSEDYRW